MSIRTNSVSNTRIQTNAYSDSCLSQLGKLLNFPINVMKTYFSLLIGARLFLLFSFILVFGSLIASAWVLFSYYIPHRKEKLYPGFAIFGQNLAIAIRLVRLFNPLFIHLFVICCFF